jgi:hypothetical protein
MDNILQSVGEYDLSYNLFWKEIEGTTFEFVCDTHTHNTQPVRKECETARFLPNRIYIQFRSAAHVTSQPKLQRTHNTHKLWGLHSIKMVKMSLLATPVKAAVAAVIVVLCVSVVVFTEVAYAKASSSYSTLIFGEDFSKGLDFSLWKHEIVSIQPIILKIKVIILLCALIRRWEAEATGSSNCIQTTDLTPLSKIPLCS